jgi:predicted ATP-grasp superfamily ATP-dependent carboligase
MKAEGNMKHLLDVLIAVVEYMESKLIWCVEGVGVDKVEKLNREQLKYITCNQKLAEKFQEMGHVPFHNAMLAGITGGLIAETSVSDGDFDIAALLVPTSSLYPDAMSSVIAIKTMAKIEAWKSDPKQLEESAKEVEAKVQDLLGSSLRKSGSGWSSMYQ